MKTILNLRIVQSYLHADSRRTNVSFDCNCCHLITMWRCPFTFWPHGRYSKRAGIIYGLTRVLKLGFDLWPFDLRVSACRGPAMEYMSTDFGVDSSSRFPFRARTNRQTDRRDWTPYPTPAAKQPAWVNIGVS